MGVGGDDQPAWRHVDLRLVVEPPERLVVEAGDEELLDQLCHGPAAAAVGHLDVAVAEVQRPRETALHRTPLPTPASRLMLRKRP